MSKYYEISSSLNTSNESLESLEDEEIEPWHSLLHKLSLFHLENLCAIFKENQYKNLSKKTPKHETGLDKNRFVEAIEEIFGNSKYSIQASILFDKIVKNENVLTWNNFLDFLIGDFSTLFEKNNEVNLKLTRPIFTPPHVKRETIAKVVSLETQRHFCYAIVSKHGRVGIYDGNVNFLTCYHVIMSREDVGRRDEERRRRNRWITDAVFMSHVELFFVASSARSITIYDASGLNHAILWLIMGVPNAITCMEYFFVNNKTTLLIGDDAGQVTGINFLQNQGELLRKKQQEKLTIFYWIELVENEKEFVSIQNYGCWFKDSVLRLNYCNDNKTIIACSLDSYPSVAVKHIENRRKSYLFKIKQGVSCFTLSHKLIITGSNDGIIRIWDIVGTHKPIATLKGHKCGIVDLQFILSGQVFISCSKDAVVKLWKVKEEICFQTLTIKFPSFRILGKTIEWGVRVFYPGPKRLCIDKNDKLEEYEQWKRSHFFVVCCNYVAKIENFHMNLNQTFENSVLPAPPVQNSMLIPSTWKVNEDNNDTITVKTPEEAKFSNVDLEIFKNRRDSLAFILDNDFLGRHRSNINFKLAVSEAKKAEMRPFVVKCAPYLTLDLPQVQELTIPLDLPVPNGRKSKLLVEKVHKMLADANSRDQIFSEASSTGSRTRSSRSSVVSFD